jgi:hypothetical protein
MKGKIISQLPILEAPLNIMVFMEQASPTYDESKYVYGKGPWLHFSHSVFFRSVF